MASTKLTEVEERLLAMVPIAPRSISSRDLVAEYYGPSIPFNGRQIIVGRMTGIQKKLSTFGGKWRLQKTGRAGPIPIKYSRVKPSK